MWRRYLAVMIYFAVNALCSALKNIAKKALFIEKRLFHRQGRLPRKTGNPRSSTLRAVFLFPLHDKRKRKKSDSLSKTSRTARRSERADEAKVFPFLSGAPRFFRNGEDAAKKNGAATRTAENSHDRTIFLVRPALSRSAPQTAPNISTNLCPTRSQEVR